MIIDGPVNIRSLPRRRGLSGIFDQIFAPAAPSSASPVYTAMPISTGPDLYTTPPFVPEPATDAIAVPTPDYARWSGTEYPRWGGFFPPGNPMGDGNFFIPGMGGVVDGALYKILRENNPHAWTYVPQDSIAYQACVKAGGQMFFGDENAPDDWYCILACNPISGICGGQVNTSDFGSFVQGAGDWNQWRPALEFVGAVIGTAAVGGEFIGFDSAGAAPVELASSVSEASIDPLTGVSLTSAAESAAFDPLTGVSLLDTAAPVVEPISADISISGSSELIAEPPVTAASAPQVVTPAAQPGMVSQIAQGVNSVSAAEASVERAYTKIKGAGGATIASQKTNTATAGGPSLDEAGIGVNVTPVLKQLAVPALALLVALLSK